MGGSIDLIAAMSKQTSAGQQELATPTHLGGIGRGRNMALVLLLFAALLFAAFCEGYLPLISLPFGLSLVGGLALAMWLAMRTSTARMLALLLSIFFIEYAKETIGIRSGLWVYHGVRGQYLFGVLAWVVAGVSTHALSTGVAIPLLRRLDLKAPRWLGSATLVGLFALVPLTLGPYWAGTGALFWSFYAFMLAATLRGTLRMPFPVFGAIAVSAWLVGNPGEFLGSVSSGAWTFPHNPDYPPFFLLASCWPLEILAQYSLSAFLAGEPLVDKVPSSKGSHA